MTGTPPEMLFLKKSGMFSTTGYQGITLNGLIEQFGHNMKYYNRLIKAIRA
jgi:hypothetical protein